MPVRSGASMPVSRAGFIAPWCIGASLGVVCVAALPRLPTVPMLAALAVVGMLMSARRAGVVLGGVLIGIAWAAWSALANLEPRIDSCVDGNVVEMLGVVQGLPKQLVPATQFDFAPLQVLPWPACAGEPPRVVRLTWHAAPPLVPGQGWQLRLRLRAVRGFANPGGFDYEGWAFAGHLDSAGSVSYGVRRALNGRAWRWDALRWRLRQQIDALHLVNAGIVLGLLTGDSGLMRSADWDLFRATGTVHLMVISGLHLGIVASVGYGVGLGVARLNRRLLRRRGAAWLGAWCAALLITGYAGLVGWGVPVQRAWFGTLLALWAATSGRRRAFPVLFSLVLIVVLLHDPVAPLRAGFWLSFGAVAVLLGYFMPRVGRTSTLRLFVSAQLVLFVTLGPLMLATVGQFAWLSPLANLVAVPLVSLLVVPANLFAVLMLQVLPDVGAMLFGWIDAAVGLLASILKVMRDVGGVSWAADDDIAQALISITAAALLLLPLTWRARAVLLPCVVLCLATGRPSPAFGSFATAVLDVGQGLAVVVTTQNHRLLYDAGPRFPSGLDLGSIAVLPALRNAGATRLDMVMLSHADIDHVGGYPAVAGQMMVRTLLGGEAVASGANLQRCVQGQRWQWDGVAFEVLHPVGGEATDNDRSCVLLVGNESHRVLLPGDLSGIGEQTLLSHWRGAPLDVLVAAHHGSKTSNSAALIEATHPRLFLVSAGYRNRFGHPDDSVIRRARTNGARVYVTAYSGALLWRSDDPEEVVQWRTVARPYWRVGNCRLSAAATRESCRADD